MTTEPYTTSAAADPARPETIELPRPTLAPFILVAGLSFAAAGLAFNTAFFLVVGAAIFVVGLVGWIVELLPGRGHVHLEAVEPLPRPVIAALGNVEHLVAGTPGYRVQLPRRIHPVSAGAWGGLVGGALMPIPALAWGLLSAHHSIWYPVNLLAGMVLPGVGAVNLDEFHLSLFITGVIIHVSMCLAIGLMLGVMLPTLPHVPKSLAWGGLLMPLLWLAVSFVLMGLVNPLLGRHVEWPWFILSQFAFGVGAAAVIANTSKLGPVLSGLLGGAAGGVIMSIPALLWSLSTGRGVWYPVNLLAGLVVPDMPTAEAALRQFHAEWFFPAVMIHAGMSATFGVAYALAMPRLRPIPAPFVWGALLLPLLWTGATYGLMGVVNPILQQGVDWPWFIVSQFVFGLAVATVVVRSEKIEMPPVGTGPNVPVRPAPGQAEGRP
jgi:5TMR of 5TMR-LYT